MHVGEASEDLLAKVPHVGHLNRLLVFLSLAQLVLERPLTELHHDVLNQTVLLVERVEEVDELHHIGGALQQGHHFVLARNNVACFLGSLDGDLDVSVLVKCLEDKA